MDIVTGGVNHLPLDPIKNGTNISSLSSSINRDELLYDVPVGLIILLSIFYGGISIIAVVGNALVIWIVGTTKQMQTVTNLFIANLALADVVIGMFAIPFQFQAALLQRWNLPDFMCPFCPFVQYVSVNVSVFTLTAIAVDRHRAIINPLRARPPKYISKIVITIIWIVSILFSIPIAYAFRVRQVEDMRLHDEIIYVYLKPFCDNVNLGYNTMLQYRYYLVFVQYVIPFCVISFVYIQMAIRLWGSKTPGNAQDSRDVTLMRNKKRVIKMLIIVVLLFGLCWLPLQSYNIIHVTWDAVNEYRFINIVWFFCDWLAMSNSCYNPFIYGIYNEKFKREFKRRFPLFRLGFDQHQHEVSEKTVSMYTRATSVQSTTNSTAPSNRGKCISLKYCPATTNNNNIEGKQNTLAMGNVNGNSNEWATSSTNNNLSKLSWLRHSTPSPVDWNKNNCTTCNPKIYYQHVTQPLLAAPPSNDDSKKLLYQPLNITMNSNNQKCCCQNKLNTNLNIDRKQLNITDVNSTINTTKFDEPIMKNINTNNNNNNINNCNNINNIDGEQIKIDSLIVDDFENLKSTNKFNENINNNVNINNNRNNNDNNNINNSTSNNNNNNIINNDSNIINNIYHLTNNTKKNDNDMGEDEDEDDEFNL